MENWEREFIRIRASVDAYHIPTEVTAFFESDMNTSPVLTEHTFREYKRFILLSYLAKEGKRFVPSHFVKIAWENHTAQTSFYRKFCYELFGKFIQSCPLPREVDLKVRQEYIDTLLVYKGLYGVYAPEQIWPDPEIRFDYSTLYSYKYFNIYSYINEVLSKFIGKADQVAPVKEDDEEKRERRLSIGSMSVSENPSRGREYISYRPNTSIA